MMRRNNALVRTLSVCLLLSGGSQTALAQAQVADDTSTQQAVEDGDTTDQGEAATPTELVVTGSRITRAGFAAPTPVNVLPTEDLIRKAPSNLADALNQLPVFQNSISANQQQFSQANRQRTGNYLNLRALGTQRVLVLQDGQRLPPTGTNGGIDASLVPQLLTERVDIVTGGASAVYGSDAVSGVVNFVLNKRLEGLRSQFQRGISTGGYNGSYRIGLAGGTALLGDRLHIIASAERFHSDGLDKRDKPIVGRSFQATGLGTAADPFRYIDGVVYSTVANGGYVMSGPAAIIGRQFAPNGELVPFDGGLPSGKPGLQRFGDGAMIGQACCSLVPSQTATQFFGRAEYEFSEAVSGYVSAGYNFSRNSDNPVSSLRQITIFNGNAFLTPSVRAAVGSTPSFDVSRAFNEFEGNEVTQKSNSLVINAGLDGKLGDRLKWRLGYVHGETEFSVLNVDIENAKFYAAADAVRDPSGQIVCKVTLTNPGLYPGCVPLNPFGVGNTNRAAFDYVNGESRYRTRNKLDSVQAVLSGDLFDLGAGPISFAIGAEYRKQTLRQTSNSNPTIPVDFTGLRGLQSFARLKFATTNVGIANGSFNVKEAFGELGVPLLKDSAVGSLELSGAARLTDYSTSGSVTTWKVGGIYDPVEGVRFRATLSRDIRAPTLFELFAGETVNSLSFADRLTGVQATTAQVGGGNADLKPEVARTFTGGVVLRPQFLPGFSFSADYFNIKIDEAIGTPFSAIQIIDQCFASNQTSPLCAQIERPLGPNNTSPANTPTRVLVNNQNLSTLRLSGIDLEASYNFDLLGGRTSVRALATRQLTFEQINAPGQPLRKFVGTADFNDVQFPLALPKWRGTVSLGYTNGPVTLTVQERIIGGYDRSHVLVYEQNRIGAVAYTDLGLSVAVPGATGEMELFATANNLFNRQPPLVPVTNTPGLTVPTIRSAYDIVGRYITVGARIKL